MNKEKEKDQRANPPGGVEGKAESMLLPLRETPAYRALYQVQSCNLAELLAAVLRGYDQIKTAYGLLDAFGGLQGIANATLEELCRVEGMAPDLAGSLRAAIELAQRMELPGEAAVRIQSPEDAAVLLVPRLRYLEQEVMLLLLLDTRNGVIGEPLELLRGSLNSSVVRIAELFRPALRVNAAGLLLAHNHPSRDPAPSPEDIQLTRAAIEAGQLLDIEVVDHLVIGGNRFVSMKRNGLGFG